MSARNGNEDAGDKRSRIIESASRLFSRQGYSETAMKDIADDAGIAVGTIYLYYKNKEDLLSGIYNQSSVLLLARIKEKMEQQTGPLGKFMIYLEESIRYAFDHPDFFLIVFIDMRRKEIELPKRPVFANFRNYLILGESIIKQGQLAGVFAAGIPAAKLNLGIVAMWAGLVLTLVLEPGFRSNAKECRSIQELVRTLVLEGILIQRGSNSVPGPIGPLDRKGSKRIPSRSIKATDHSWRNR